MTCRSYRPGMIVLVEVRCMDRRSCVSGAFLDCRVVFAVVVVEVKGIGMVVHSQARGRSVVARKDYMRDSV